jgi:hypothetical protein
MRTNVHGNGNGRPVRALLLLPSSICGTEMSRCVVKRMQPLAADRWPASEGRGDPSAAGDALRGCFDPSSIP